MTGLESGPRLEVVWLSPASSLEVRSADFEELRVDVDRRVLVVRDWFGNDTVVVDGEELFGVGPDRALAVRRPDRPFVVLVAGEEGSALYELDLETAEWRQAAELPRFPNVAGGMCRLEVLSRGAVTLLHWELGILGLGMSLELLWRHDLAWNHSIVALTDDEIWFDLMYETGEVPQRIGEAPWGFALVDGRELSDQSPPTL